MCFAEIIYWIFLGNTIIKTLLGSQLVGVGGVLGAVVWFVIVWLLIHYIIPIIWGANAINSYNEDIELEAELMAKRNNEIKTDQAKRLNLEKESLHNNNGDVLKQLEQVLLLKEKGVLTEREYEYQKEELKKKLLIGDNNLEIKGEGNNEHKEQGANAEQPSIPYLPHERKDSSGISTIVALGIVLFLVLFAIICFYFSKNYKSASAPSVSETTSEIKQVENDTIQRNIALNVTHERQLQDKSYGQSSQRDNKKLNNKDRSLELELSAIYSTDDLLTNENIVNIVSSKGIYTQKALFDYSYIHEHFMKYFCSEENLREDVYSFSCYGAEVGCCLVEVSALDDGYKIKYSWQCCNQ